MRHRPGSHWPLVHLTAPPPYMVLDLQDKYKQQRAFRLTGASLFPPKCFPCSHQLLPNKNKQSNWIIKNQKGDGNIHIFCVRMTAIIIHVLVEAHNRYFWTRQNQMSSHQWVMVWWMLIGNYLAFTPPSFPVWKWRWVKGKAEVFFFVI